MVTHTPKENSLSEEFKILAKDAASIPEDAAEILRERLALAARLTERVTKAGSPKEFGNSWPPILRDFADLVAQEGATGDRDRETNHLILQPTARQITQAEAALMWRRYVDEAQALAALNIWLRCKALRIRSWQKEAQRRGFSRETAKRRLARAFYLIIIGLAQDNIPLDEAER